MRRTTQSAVLSEEGIDDARNDRRLPVRPGALHGAGRRRRGLLCHCRMCQRATGGVSIAFKNLAKAEIAWEHEPDWYASSPIAKRPFCRECGTPLGFALQRQRPDGPDRRQLRRSVARSTRPSNSASRASTRHGTTPATCRASKVDRDRERDRALAGRRAGGARVNAVRTERIASFDGTELAVHRWARAGRCCCSTGCSRAREMNWIRFGHAAKLAEAGFEAIMPDLRAHGAERRAARSRGLSARRAGARRRWRVVEALGLDRLRPRRLLARRAHRGAARSSRASRRGGWCSAGWGSRGWPGGSGARRSSSMRSTGSMRSSAAIRRSWRCSS